MPKYRYDICDGKHIIDVLEANDRDGYDLVAVTKMGDWYEFFFKKHLEIHVHNTTIINEKTFEEKVVEMGYN